MRAVREIEVRIVERDSRDFAALVSEFEAELERRYPGISEDGLPDAAELMVSFVAYGGETPLGCVALRALEPGIGEVKRMFVAPHARGRGVARMLLAASEDWAGTHGLSVLRLGSGLRQPEAIALYESSGFGRIPLFGEYEGAEQCVCYEKSLV